MIDALNRPLDRQTVLLPLIRVLRYGEAVFNSDFDRVQLDNLSIAVLTKLNDLAERHGLKPYDFVATFRYEPDPGFGHGKHVLEFECPASGNALREERFDRILSALGIIVTDDKGAVLEGEPSKIIDALDNALSLAPKPRTLF